ncbi:ECF transporter S component [Actinoallomurus rhizosphaericola]|uniref:ECF transporter S component n=1 Tax=Actinoallomurus rhizosphaericola TaxID=2952536 RepID=UPI0020935466|nr:ECF transporter S component [Actinoallomurus rhizosphaericola]MCO5996470.1 ECF transporter S component [Actinoallomurus rhizosphaericola]
MNPVRLRARSGTALVLVSLAGLAAFCWPLLVTPGARITQSTFAPWIFVLLLPLLLAVALAEVAEGGIDAKAIALLGVLGAVGAALRPLGTNVAGFEPMFFVLVHGGRVLGRGFGYLLGSVTMFASALITAGVGPWLPYQILGAAWVGFFAGCLPRRPRGRVEIAMLAAYGAVAGFLYGWLQNLGLWPFAGGMSSSISFHPGAPLADNLGRFVAFDLATSLGFDVPRAIFTAILVAVTGRPVLLALRRAARRAAFEAPGGDGTGFEVPAGGRAGEGR